MAHLLCALQTKIQSLASMSLRTEDEAWHGAEASQTKCPDMQPALMLNTRSRKILSVWPDVPVCMQASQTSVQT